MIKRDGRAVLMGAVGLAVLLGGACRSPADTPKGPPPPATAAEPSTPAQLPGVDISSLTPREQTKWREYVSQLLAPCSDQPVSVAQCVEQKRPCAACTPSAQFLVDRVRRGDARSQVEEAFRLRFSPEAVKSIDLSNSPVEGATSPTVTIVEWADFECPHCAMAAPIFKQLVEKYPDQVQLVFKNYPLSAHEHSDAAARAAVAAFHQGKFWQLNQELFANQKSGLDDQTILRLAREAGLDIKKFEVDKASEATADQVARDRKQADELHLEGTPMIYINGRHFALEHFDLRQDLEPWVQLEIAMNSSAPAGADQGPSAASSKADRPTKVQASTKSAGSARVEASSKPRAQSN
jgi:protein-disulfide isomerase